MKPTSWRYVIMPQFLNLTNQNLKYIDALTYLTIRSFHNSKTKKCYPSYETIAEKSKMSRGFIIESVERLENAGFIKVTRSKTKHISNTYSFSECEQYEQISYDLFDTDLTGNEKGMLICLRQFFVHGLLKCIYTIKELAKHLGVSYRTVHCQLQSLIKKGFVVERQRILKGSKKGLKTMSLTDKIDWNDYQYNVIQMPTFILKVG